MNKIIYAGKHLITFSVSRHAHSSWELIYCTSGNGRLSYDGGTISYSAGDIVLIPPLVYHQNESSTGFTNIHLNMRSTSLNLRKPTMVQDDGNHFLLDAFTAAFYHFSRHPGKQTMLLATYANLIVLLIQEGLSSPVRNPVVEEITKNIVLSYPDENFELDSYLRALPFNYDYLRKLFKRETGVTPHQFLVDTRLQAAAECLSFSDERQINISEIAHLSGFREPLYFSKVFRKKYGMSPTQYQSQAAAAAANVPDSESIKIRPEDA